MSKHKQLHFIAIILSTFALSPALVPVCLAQLGDTNGSDVAGDSGSDEVDADTETGGSGSDTVDAGSGETDTVRATRGQARAEGRQARQPSRPTWEI